MSINFSGTTAPDMHESAVTSYEQWKEDFVKWLLRISAVVLLIAVIFATPSNPRSTNILNFILTAIVIFIALLPLPYSIRAFIYLALSFAGATGLLISYGIEGEATLLYLGTIALTALLYERGEEFITLFLALLTIGAIGFLTITGQVSLIGWLPGGDEFHKIMVGDWQGWLVYALDLLAVSTAVILAIRLLKGRFNKILQEARISLGELGASGSQLEARVRERTVELDIANKQITRRAAQLKAITELSESIAQLKDLNEIFPATTNLISDRFGFYHVGIFLIDQDREFAILQAANSEGGKRMLERGHRLRLGIGVVGFCAQSGQPRIVLNVGADAVFFNNPDLPNTRSEAALPLISRGVTMGVLDVQSTEAGAFSSEDLEVLTALGNQVSIALENARLLTEARAAYSQVQEVYNEFTRAEWSRTVSQNEQSGFSYQAGHIEMTGAALQKPEVLSAAQSGEISSNPVNGSDEKRSAVAVPVKLRGEVIGVLHVEAGDPLKAWQDDEISLVQAVAERAAFAMENARLFQDARRRATKERLISEATARISSAFNVENILRTTAEELERVLGGSEISIQFQSKE